MRQTGSSRGAGVAAVVVVATASPNRKAEVASSESGFAIARVTWFSSFPPDPVRAASSFVCLAENRVLHDVMALLVSSERFRTIIIARVSN